MDSVDALLEECAALHGHICPGQLLGVRMALLGCELLGVADPKGVDRKRLIVWVEIDRCMTDAISAVTGVRLGRRTLKFLDYGKVAATFHDPVDGRAFRVVALDSSRTLADARFPEISSKKERQMKAYREADNCELFKVQEVRVNYSASEEPGRPTSRVSCGMCDEGINDAREMTDTAGLILCKSCAGGGYYNLIGDRTAI